jgi:hypothetical protein
MARGRRQRRADAAAGRYRCQFGGIVRREITGLLLEGKAKTHHLLNFVDAGLSGTAIEKGLQLLCRHRNHLPYFVPTQLLNIKDQNRMLVTACKRRNFVIVAFSAQSLALSLDIEHFLNMKIGLGN